MRPGPLSRWMRFRRPPRTPIGKLERRSNAGCAPDRRAAKRKRKQVVFLKGPFRWKRGQTSYSSRAGSAETFLPRPGTGVVSPHYVLEGRHRNPAVPIKAMRCNARMVLIVLETELVHFNLRTGTDTMPLTKRGSSRASLSAIRSPQTLFTRSYEHSVLGAAAWRNSAILTSAGCPNGRPA
jgi:hypothetical protein